MEAELIERGRGRRGADDRVSAACDSARKTHPSRQEGHAGRSRGWAGLISLGRVRHRTSLFALHRAGHPEQEQTTHHQAKGEDGRQFYIQLQAQTLPPIRRFDGAGGLQAGDDPVGKIIEKPGGGCS